MVMPRIKGNQHCCARTDKLSGLSRRESISLVKLYFLIWLLSKIERIGTWAFVFSFCSETEKGGRVLYTGDLWAGTAFGASARTRMLKERRVSREQTVVHEGSWRGRLL